MTKPSLTRFLADRVALHGSGGDVARAAQRASLTHRIYEAYPAMRRVLHELGRGRSAHPSSSDARDWCAAAEAEGLLMRRGDSFRALDGGTRAYVNGMWLEELVALAMSESHCADIRFGQRIRWRAINDTEDHYNEVDALCLHADQIIVVSCKATANDLLERSRGEQRIFDALLELSYWNAHFFQNKACPIFVTTTDFFDEDRGIFRSAKLMERARALGLQVITADFSTYAAFAGRFHALLQQNRTE